MDRLVLGAFAVRSHAQFADRRTILSGDDENDIELSALLAEVGSEFGDVSVVCRVAISQRRVPVFVQQNSL